MTGKPEKLTRTRAAQTKVIQRTAREGTDVTDAAEDAGQTADAEE